MADTRVPLEIRERPGGVAVNLLFAMAHIPAVAGVWLAVYNLRGTEGVEVDATRIVVRRSGGGITVPLKLLHRGSEKVVVLDTSSAPGKVHPRLEVRSERTAIRFGAGLSDVQARVVCTALAEALERADPHGD
ncbi:MAG: hypothetical protein IBX62_09195 [Coriobacteriia bacterium]|nr:hypothetical protein [Coriobacteriia bacterium]